VSGSTFRFSGKQANLSRNPAFAGIPTARARRLALLAALATEAGAAEGKRIVALPGRSNAWLRIAAALVVVLGCAALYFRTLPPE